ncbi:lipoyl(octanoyl) transferase [Verruconis gallopava]|uniref:Octanoyltransferase n=1 Tax=Verruconis gallopava TaxID=253628 RepID=A0A0D1XYZ2_9PEZI|nr:lipoyl(octanoyl) transferase [Verruconis gallopava]KIW07986.1 lipoyl(octanoyl) transferase [Verruconis gallopava]
MKLRHIHLPSLTHYKHGDRVQDLIVRQHLAAKADPSLPKPPPTVITAQFHPVYTTGRRDYGRLTNEAKQILRDGGRAEVFEALRGGQTTYHGPGQLTAYPIIDLKQHMLGTRDYICVLEKSLIALCAKYGVKAMTTENTGVWITEDKKIAAVGVHLRRYVSSHGIGLNVDRRVDWGFGRIVACGLEGKSTTSLEAEGATGLQVEQVGKDFVEELASRLSGVEGIEVVDDPLRKPLE